MTEERKAARINIARRSIEAVRREEERRFEAAANRYFRGLYQRLSGALGITKKASRNAWDMLMDLIPTQAIGDGEAVTLDESEREKLAGSFVGSLIDWGAEENFLFGLFAPLWSESYRKGAETAQTLYHLNAVQRPELVSLAKLHGGERIRSIVGTSKEQIRKIVSSIIAEGIEAGTSNSSLAKSIQEQLDASPGRARVIAAQECNASLNEGHFDMMVRAGAKTKTWHCSNSLHSRESHKKLDGDIRPIDKPFKTMTSVLLMKPCDPACRSAGEVVNCHCFLTYDEERV